jgi:hypothetical protein
VAREVKRVDGLAIRLIAIALDPRGDAELVQELSELERSRVDHLEVSLFRLAEVVHAHKGLREPVDRRQRRTQVVSGERDKLRKTGV